MYDAGHPELVLCGGWGGEEGRMGVQMEGTHVCLWLIHADVWQKSPQYCEAITLQLKF